MNYLQDKNIVYKNSDPKKSKTPFGLLLLLAVIIYIVGAFVYNPIAKPVLVVAGPFLSGNTALARSLQNTMSFFSTQKKLVQENVQLKQKLRQESALKFEALNRVSLLTHLSESFSQARQDLVPAEIISRPRIVPYDILVASVDDSEIKAGSRVFWHGDILLGEVIQTSGSITKIKMYSSPGVERQVIMESGNTPAVLVGRGGGNFKVTLPRGVEIKENSRVYLNKDVEDVGAPVVLGIVGSIEKTAEDPFQTVFVEVPVNIYTLDWVFIER